MTDELPLPIASSEIQAEAEELEEPLIADRPVALRALLAATALLRTGTVSAGAAAGFYLGSHYAAAWAGVVMAVQGASEAISAPILARYADRVGRRKFLVGGPMLGALGVLLLAVAAQPRSFALTRILEGLAAGAFVPTALGTIAAATAHDHRARAKASSAFEAANLVGYALGFVLSGFIWHSLHSGGFAILAFFYVAAGVVCWQFVPKVPALPVSPLGVVFRAVTGPGPIRAFLPAWMATFGFIGAYGGNLTALLKRTISTSPSDGGQVLAHSLDERLIGGFLTMMVIILIVGIALWVPVLTRNGPTNTMRRAVPGAWIVSLGLLALNHTSLSAWFVFLPVIAIGVLILSGFGPAAVNYLAQCSETYAADRSALMSFYTVTLAIGGSLGALFGAVFGAWLQIDGLIALGILLSIYTYFTLIPVDRYEQALRNIEDS